MSRTHRRILHGRPALRTRAPVPQTLDYCERLFQLSDERLACFDSPMKPFINPGSCGFGDPGRFGYRLFVWMRD